MMRKTGWGNGLLCGMLLFGGAKMAAAQVTVKKITYHGWQGAYRLANKTTELIFVPQIGRIMRYGLIGGENMLWNNRSLDGKTTDFENPPKDWQNYGGDKLWPAPQSRWGWPPDLQMDSGSQKVTVTKDKHLLTTGRPDTKYHVRFQREITLEADGSGVVIQNTLINTGGKPDTWGVWQITQTDDPNLIRMPLHKTGRFESGVYVFGDPQPVPIPDNVTIADSEVHILRSTKHASKTGTDSPQGWLRIEKDGIIFETAQTVEAGRDYPDNGCALEVFTSEDPNKYVELELLGPLTPLAPKASVSLTTRWKLSRKQTG